MVIEASGVRYFRNTIMHEVLVSVMLSVLMVITVRLVRKLTDFLLIQGMIHPWRYVAPMVSWTERVIRLISISLR